MAHLHIYRRSFHHARARDRDFGTISLMRLTGINEHLPGFCTVISAFLKADRNALQLSPLDLQTLFTRLQQCTPEDTPHETTDLLTSLVEHLQGVSSDTSPELISAHQDPEHTQGILVREGTLISSPSILFHPNGVSFLNGGYTALQCLLMCLQLPAQSLPAAFHRFVAQDRSQVPAFSAFPETLLRRLNIPEYKAPDVTVEFTNLPPS